MVGRTEKALHSLGKLQLQEAIVRHGHPDIAANTIGKGLADHPIRSGSSGSDSRLAG